MIKMKNLIITSGLPFIYKSGGATHDLNVLTVLNKKMEFEFIPAPKDIYISSMDEIKQNNYYNYINNLKLNMPEYINNIFERRIKFNKIDDVIKYIYGDIKNKLVYSQDESIYNIMLLYKLSFNNKCAALFKLTPFMQSFMDDYKYFSGLIDVNIMYHQARKIVKTFINGRNRKIYYFYIKNFAAVFSNSKNVLSQSGIDKLKIKKIVIDPPNSFNPFNSNILKYKSSKKDYIIYFARFIPEKGIYEIPLILREIIEINPDINLYVAGEFYNFSIVNKIFNYKKVFFEKIKKLGLENNLKYMGFLQGEELYKKISGARALIYPSHSDSVPLSVLESLALNTPVVAYNIPAIIEFYSNIKSVKIVDEYDYKSMAENAVKFFNMDNYDELFDDENLKNLIKKHSSWENVADAELNALESLI